MIIYRPHRGGLREAMEHAREFESIDEMKQYIVKEHASLFDAPPFDDDDIVIADETVDDPRTGWKDTRYVSVKRFKEKLETPQCIGLCATDYK